MVRVSCVLRTVILVLFLHGLCTRAADSIATQVFYRVEGLSCLPVSASAAVLASVQVTSNVQCSQSCAEQAGTCSAFAFSALRGICHVFSSVTWMSSGCGGSSSADDWAAWSTSPVEIPLCLNGGMLTSAGGCQCFYGFVGDTCERLMEDCMEALDSGYYPNMDGDAAILMAKPSLSPHNITVLCRQNGLTVVLRMVCRHIGMPSVLHHFNRALHGKVIPDGYIKANVQNQRYSKGLNFTWAEYMSMFNLPNSGGAHWMGLKNLYYITNSKQYKLTINIRLADASILVAQYQSFVITDDVTFKVRLGSFVSGPAELDLLQGIDGRPFSTYDNNNSNKSSSNNNGGSDCPVERGGGWWYPESCGTGYNLVGKFIELPSGTFNTDVQNVHYGSSATAGHLKLFTLALEP